MKIGIIVGSVRDKRVGAAVGDWVLEHATRRQDASFELIDLKRFDVPIFTSSVPPMMADKSYDDERVQAWSDAVDACDAFVFVTTEYNHGVPGAFKNAVDSLGKEWVGKPVAIVGYGAVGGIRAIENWRTVMANFSAPVVRAEVNLSIFSDLADGLVKPSALKEANLADMLTQLVELAGKLA